MIEIVMVRHAQPDWEPGGRAVENPELTPLGRQQALRLADALVGENFDILYVSPLRRAVETAEPIAERLGMAPCTQRWLEELRLPPMSGQPVEQVQDFLASARRRDLEAWWDGLPGGESFRHFHERITSGLAPLLEERHRATIHPQGAYHIWRVPESPPQKFLIVAHAGAIAVMLSYLLGIDPVPWEWERFRIGWAGMARVVTVDIAGGAVWALHRLNGRDHLQGLPDPAG